VVNILLQPSVLVLFTLIGAFSYIYAFDVLLVYLVKATIGRLSSEIQKTCTLIEKTNRIMESK
jgi:hypothetical protein